MNNRTNSQTDKKKKGFALAPHQHKMRDIMLHVKIGHASQDLKTTLEKWIPPTEKEVNNQRFRALRSL